MWKEVKERSKVWLKQLFCWHELKVLHSDLYKLTGTNNPKSGTVVIATAQCSRCKKFFILPSDLKIDADKQNS